MSKLADAIGRIHHAPAPVVFLDTCVLLDVIRAPARNHSATVRAALDLLVGAVRGRPTVYPVVSRLSLTEWMDHADEVEGDCESVVAACDAVSESMTHLGLPAPPLLPPDAFGVPKKLRELSANLRDASICLDDDAEALARAINRIVDVKMPAKRGGRGAKDAVIVEHAVCLADGLRRQGFHELCLFVSSNTADFADRNNVRIHPDLASSFTQSNLLFAPSLASALTMLTRSGWSA